MIQLFHTLDINNIIMSLIQDQEGSNAKIELAKSSLFTVPAMHTSKAVMSKAHIRSIESTRAGSRLAHTTLTPNRRREASVMTAESRNSDGHPRSANGRFEFGQFLGDKLSKTSGGYKPRADKLVKSFSKLPEYVQKSQIFADAGNLFQKDQSKQIKANATSVITNRSFSPIDKQNQTMKLPFEKVQKDLFNANLTANMLRNRKKQENAAISNPIKGLFEAADTSERKTKIICTVADSFDDVASFKQLLEKGMNSVRLRITASNLD